MSSVKPPFLTWLDIDIGFVNPYTFVGVKQSFKKINKILRLKFPKTCLKIPKHILNRELLI